MANLFEYQTIAAVYALKSFLQALAMLYVWYVDRQYPPARKWAIGSLLVAIGTVLVAREPNTASAALVVLRNLLVYAGLFILVVGILEACAAPVPWRFFAIVIVTALAALWWFSALEPSLPARVGIFSVSIAIAGGRVAMAAFSAPPGPLRGTQRLIGILIAAQVIASLVRNALIYAAPVLSDYQMHAVDMAFILVSVGTSFLLAMALTVLTGQRTTALLSAVMDNLDQGVAMFDEHKRLLICNARYGELYGADLSESRPGTALATIISCRIARGIFAGADATRYFHEQTTTVSAPTMELHHLTDGRSIVASRRPLRFGGWLSTHADVTAVQKIEARVAYLAHHDSLTGAANRQFFSERMADALARLSQSGEGFAILLIDLDRFKAINDTLGHPSGDALLAAVAERLRSCAADIDIVARLGGDEFAILQLHGPSIDTGEDAAARLAKRLLDVVGAPYDLNGQMVMVGASIGIARAPENGSDADQLMRNADLALYRAKAAGRNCHRFYDRDMDADLRARHSLEIALRNSIIRSDFVLEYQPVLNVERHEVCAAEALVRWQHPSGSVIKPATFISIAEETGLIMPLGEWILQRACSDAVAWPEQIRVSVNLSPAQFANGQICETVEKALRDTRLPAARLELEVTESIFLQSDETLLAMLHRLKALGVSIALDDFGTGYSSLNYLTKFPFDRIKIDKAFVVDLGHSRENSAIVAAIISVARSLAMATTAEGVETSEQFELLRHAGCTEMQGYLFGRPKPVSELDFAAPAVSRPTVGALNRPVSRARVAARRAG